MSRKEYGSDKAKIPRGVANYIYLSITVNNNLQNYLYKHHAEEYNQTVLKNNWKYKLLTQINDAASCKNAVNVHDWALSQFSLMAFLEHLVCFIVADDQVSSKNLVFFHMLTCL